MSRQQNSPFLPSKKCRDYGNRHKKAQAGFNVRGAPVDGKTGFVGRSQLCTIPSHLLDFSVFNADYHPRFEIVQGRGFLRILERLPIMVLKLKIIGLDWDSGHQKFTILNYDLKHYISNKLTLNYGLNSLYYPIQSGTIRPYDELHDEILSDAKKYAFENALLANEERNVSPDFWTNPKQAEISCKNFRFKEMVEAYNDISNAVQRHLEVLESLTKKADASMKMSMPPIPNTLEITRRHTNSKYAFLEEGDNFKCRCYQIHCRSRRNRKSCDWASMLMRMYLIGPKKAVYKVKEFGTVQAGDVWLELKQLRLKSKAKFAFGYLKGEKRRSIACVRISRVTAMQTPYEFRFGLCV
ncbi:hypothetical protein FQA39_LY19243 [Lamprigera yunnana]|nr:hypothetical protein FQA39_LY19243 [Lamprigera yunnana]